MITKETQIEANCLNHIWYSGDTTARHSGTEVWKYQIVNGTASQKISGVFSDLGHGSWNIRFIHMSPKIYRRKYIQTNQYAIYKWICVTKISYYTHIIFFLLIIVTWWCSLELPLCWGSLELPVSWRLQLWSIHFQLWSIPLHIGLQQFHCSICTAITVHICNTNKWTI